jgi:phosphoribosylformylglycinamidine synthase subunit PurQ / glutaminase
MLPGALMRNANLKFICKDVDLSIDNANTAFTRAFGEKRSFTIPIAHGEGNYFADKEALDRLEGEGRVIFRYKQNPNGAARNIAGVMNEKGNVLGMMPHPERAADAALGRTEGVPLFQSLIEAIG